MVGFCFGRTQLNSLDLWICRTKKTGIIPSHHPLPSSIASLAHPQICPTETYRAKVVVVGECHNQSNAAQESELPWSIAMLGDSIMKLQGEYERERVCVKNELRFVIV